MNIKIKIKIINGGDDGCATSAVNYGLYTPFIKMADDTLAFIVCIVQI